MENVTLSKEDYFFFEWLILEKNLSEDEFSFLSSEELETFKLEYLSFVSGLR